MTLGPLTRPTRLYQLKKKLRRIRAHCDKRIGVRPSQVKRMRSGAERAGNCSCRFSLVRITRQALDDVRVLRRNDVRYRIVSTCHVGWPRRPLSDSAAETVQRSSFAGATFCPSGNEQRCTNSRYTKLDHLVMPRLVFVQKQRVPGNARLVPVLPRRSGLTVDVLPMTNLYHKHYPGFILNRVNDTVCSVSDSILVGSGQFLTPLGSGVVSQSLNVFRQVPPKLTTADRL